jgi:aspartyl-tRNA(Asn)/glutamyl-tRNA(Gln) amidotransferase subunit B
MSSIPRGWEVVIGLETHTQLSTVSKIFSGSATQYGAPPNTQANAVDLALPGTLPVLNKHAVECAIKFGLAVNAKIASRSIFARKNYFYPDLPKGYQISQYELPVVVGGEVKINVGDVEKSVQLTRAHLEEDAGKSLHEGLETSGVSGIDLNRAGTPLLEIVTEPCMHSADEAVAYAKALHGIVTWIGICDGNMQEGSFRCDANVSVRPAGETKLGTRAEIKNVNSFKFLEKAINYEINRQIEVIEDGGKVVQETRLYDSDKNETRSMRSKEDAMDYRYFPDPDLLPLIISQGDIQRIRETMPPLPQTIRERYLLTLAALDRADDASIDVEMEVTIKSELKKPYAWVLSAPPELLEYIELVAIQLNDMASTPIAESWVRGELSAALNEAGLTIRQSPIKADMLASLLKRIADGTVSGKMAKEIFRHMWAGEGDADTIIEKRGLKQVTDASAIEKMVDDVIAANPKSVEEFKAGKEKALNALFGQVMKASNKTANPAQVTEILKRKLSS